MSCPGCQGLFGDHGFYLTASSFVAHLLCALKESSVIFFLHQVILDTGAVEEGALPPRAHSIRAVATKAAFLRNGSVSKVLEAATWRSNPVFASFYSHDISYSLDLCHSLGPFVAGVSVFCFTLSTFYVSFHFTFLLLCPLS